jgi:hypothetical protein
MGRTGNWGTVDWTAVTHLQKSRDRRRRCTSLRLAHMPIARRSSALLVALVLAACGSDAAPGTSELAAWTVDSATVTIGRDERPEALLERVTGASRLPDGSILVADLGDAPLRRYRADGSLDARLARSGAGPGEITYLAYLFRCGDEVITHDIDGRRISVFSLDGAYRREFRFALPEGQQAPYLSACNAAERFAHLGWGSRGRPQAGTHRDTVPVWTTAAPDGPTLVLDSVPSSERWGQTYNGRIVGSMPLPFGRQPVLGIGRDRIYVGSGDTFTIRVYAFDGSRLDSLHLPVELQPVTPADIRDRIERYVAERGESERASMERESAEIIYPTTHVAYTALKVDAEDYVWVRAYAAPSSALVEWQVFSPAGRHVATVPMPRALEVFEIGTDYVLGKYLDAAEGQPLVRLYPLRRSP